MYSCYCVLLHLLYSHFQAETEKASLTASLAQDSAQWIAKEQQLQGQIQQLQSEARATADKHQQALQEFTAQIAAAQQRIQAAEQQAAASAEQLKQSRQHVAAEQEHVEQLTEQLEALREQIAGQSTDMSMWGGAGGLYPAGWLEATAHAGYHCIRKF